MTEKPTNDELQEAVMRIESGKKQLEALLQQSRLIETALLELHTASEVLEQLKKNKPGTEILVPIGGDSFIKAAIKDSENVIVGVGAKVSVEKKIDNVIAIMKQRADELGKTLVNVRENAVAIGGQIEELNAKAQDLFQKTRPRER